MKIKILVMVLLLIIAGCAQDTQPKETQSKNSANKTPANNTDKTEATCDDGIKNQQETDVDCGGSCKKCDEGENCLENADCTTGFCHENVCKVPSCNDGIKNQDEKEVDCGGVCSPCEPESQQVTNYTLTKKQKKELNNELTQGTKSEFLVNAHPSGLTPGESHVYAYGITNTNLNADNTTFRFHIEFKRARDTMNSPISVNETLVLSWFDKNDFPQPVLGKYEQKTFPVGFTVGKYIAKDKKTTPGSYYFEIVVEEDVGYTWNEYTTDKFSFRVK